MDQTIGSRDGNRISFPAFFMTGDEAEATVRTEPDFKTRMGERILKGTCPSVDSFGS
jgi:hypothetical protein